MPSFPRETPTLAHTLVLDGAVVVVVVVGGGGEVLGVGGELEGGALCLVEPDRKLTRSPRWASKRCC